MTPLANRSIAPDPETQGTLPTGPTGVVHRSAGPVPWHKRLALTKAPTPAAHHVLLVLGSFVSDDASDAWPSKATLAAMTGRSPRVVQRALRDLKSAGLISVRQSSGLTPHYRLSTAAPETPASPEGRRPRLWGGDASVQGGETPASPEVRTSEVISTRRAAAASPSVRTDVQHDEQPDTGDRLTCPTCANTWPARFGPTCYRCPQPTAAQLRRREQRKRDRLSEQDPPAPPDEAPARPDPPPLTPERQAQLETEAIENGYHKRDDGQWTKGPQPPPETRGQSPDSTVAQDDGTPPNGGEPGPNEQRFKAEFAKWTKGKRRRTTP